ncbi:hypothetical protein REMIM1_PE00557 (plasmid) [Rhizobium etli bv. mimosae str. Mim1]|nr:hypothetical protein REMIM1_PE00557 [Rhizobium etli bv. mimosae str. Mim1]
MGEQRPMDTIKAFVKSVWQDDPVATANGLRNPNEVWSRPDERLDSLELRRITTRESIPSPDVFDRGVRSDFFELYWADLTAGTPWEDFLGWLRYLLLRDPFSNVPAQVMLAWCLLWVITIIFSVLGILSLIPANTTIYGWDVPDFGSWRWLVLILLGAGGSLLHRLIQQTFGRVVRYTRATPNNIAARKAVRERGLQLLETLHNDGQYGRVILVGHSLGSILAYELLAFFWARHAESRRVRESTPGFGALKELEEVGALLDAEPNDDALLLRWRNAQRNLRQQLAARPAPSPAKPVNERWIISDFVTLGSPLTHAQFLMAAGKEDLNARKMSREMPTSPPVRELLDPLNAQAAAEAGMPINSASRDYQLFSFPWRDPDRTWEMHHAAVFAAVRWTNISDRSRLIFQGDLISGPLRPVFGPGVIDIDLKTVRGQAHHFTHTEYWDSRATASQLQVLRQAVNLLDRPPEEIWAGSKEIMRLCENRPGLSPTGHL